MQRVPSANESAVQVLGDETLRVIAREVADVVRQNTTIDWTVRESARVCFKSHSHSLIAAMFTVAR
jgi:Domain of unknown function (DUF3387)